MVGTQGPLLPCVRLKKLSTSFSHRGYVELDSNSKQLLWWGKADKGELPRSPLQKRCRIYWSALKYDWLVYFTIFHHDSSTRLPWIHSVKPLSCWHLPSGPPPWKIYWACPACQSGRHQGPSYPLTTFLLSHLMSWGAYSTLQTLSCCWPLFTN